MYKAKNIKSKIITILYVFKKKKKYWKINKYFKIYI